MYDTIVIGAGPAGVSAALYLARFNLNVAIVYKDYGSLAKAVKIENYYGIKEITGTELVEEGIKQAEALNVEIKKAEVLNVEKEDCFLVKTTIGEFKSKTVVLATGASRNNVRIPGVNEFKGKGVSECVLCDGFLYRGKKVGIVGAKKYMEEELENLRKFTNDVFVFTNGEDNELAFDKSKIIKVDGDELFNKIVTENGEYELDGLFLAIGSPTSIDIANKIGAFTTGGFIKVDENFMTNIEGLYAVGDAVGGLLQVAKAVGDGAIAAVSINRHLKK